MVSLLHELAHVEVNQALLDANCIQLVAAPSRGSERAKRHRVQRRGERAQRCRRSAGRAAAALGAGRAGGSRVQAETLWLGSLQLYA